jgi:Collagen triple helix repeat (20 copies)
MIRRKALLTAGVATMLVAGAGTALAAASASPVDSSGVIHGCWTNGELNGSHVFVLQDAGTSCPKGTTAISWNQAGTPGPQGPAGMAGPAGSTGATGLTGPAGATGATGASGQAGPAGADGNTVLNGTGAPDSGVGRDGDFYIDTAADMLYGPKASGTWPSTGTSLVGPAGAAGSAGAQGPAGPAGASGSTVLNGAGAPGTGVGNDGDFYIDTSAGVLYGPKAGGSWPDPGVSLVGPAGATGPAGPAGPAGPQGPAGASTAGPAGLDTTVVTNSVSVAFGGASPVTVTCPASHPYILGGGAGWDFYFTNGGPYIFYNGPELGPGAVGWTAAGANPSNDAVTPFTDTLHVWAICSE